MSAILEGGGDKSLKIFKLIQISMKLNITEEGKSINFLWKNNAARVITFANKK